MKHLLFLILLAVATNVHAQCDQFDNLLKKGDDYLKDKKPDYQEAINTYTAAILACSDRASEAQKRLAKMVSDINKLKENALAAERKAVKAQEETKAALARSDSLYEVAEAVIDKIYFYNDRFGLAYEAGKGYGFIDKQLNTKIDFRYREALPFDETGYAKVKKGISSYYLIDTTGTEFSLATDVSQFDPFVTALDFRSRKLPQLPNIVYSQIKLKILLLEYNQLDNLPEKIGELVNLQTLLLFSNQLRALPPEIGQLKNLQKLDLGDNQFLNTLPPEIRQLKNLQSLNLFRIQLRALPLEISQLINLQELDLSSNQLRYLSPEMAQLKNLRSLGLGGNQLSSLPAEVGQLINLQSLDLRANKLSSLPAEVGQLKNLQLLGLELNQLSSLPAEIRSLKSLKYLYLRENPFPPEYIEQLRKDMPWCNIEF